MASIKKLDERRYKITVSNGYRPNGKKTAKQRLSKPRPMSPSAALGSMSPTPPRSWSAASRPATPRMAR